MEANLVNSATEENMNSIDLANDYCGKAHEIYYALCDNLYDSVSELKTLQLTNKEKELLEEAEKCYATMIVKCREFKYELSYFADFIMQLADSVDPNHKIEF